MLGHHSGIGKHVHERVAVHNQAQHQNGHRPVWEILRVRRRAGLCLALSLRAAHLLVLVVPTARLPAVTK